ncbi:hypothetical protein [Pelobium manganitolerans]|uniref:hypothetical protein n=1 Tax=Pelobium manganitolerans TaxID=1842495 RepID=UPI003FA3D482
MKTKHILTLATGLLISFTACKKDDDEVGYKASAVETVSFSSPKEAAPGPSGDFGVWYYNFDTKTSSENVGQVKFFGLYSGDFGLANEGLSLGYVDVDGKTLATLSLEDITKAGLTSVEKLSTGTWYTYGENHSTPPIANRYVVVYTGADIKTASNIYIIQLNSLSYEKKESGKYVGKISFSFKSFKK